jgi:hypothetical protein
MIESPHPAATLPAPDDGSAQAPGWSWNPVGTKGRIEMLRLWDSLSDDGKRFVLTMARAKAEEEGAPRPR